MHCLQNFNDCLPFLYIFLILFLFYFLTFSKKRRKIERLKDKIKITQYLRAFWCLNLCLSQNRQFEVVDSKEALKIGTKNEQKKVRIDYANS